MTAKRTFIPSLLVAALSGVAFAAVAGGQGAKDLTMEQKDLMKQLDANQDGVISQAEAAAHPELSQRFQEIDRNGDQRLEKAEFARFEVTEEPEGEEEYR